MDKIIVVVEGTSKPETITVKEWENILQSREEETIRIKTNNYARELNDLLRRMEKDSIDLYVPCGEKLCYLSKKATASVMSRFNGKIEIIS